MKNFKEFQEAIAAQRPPMGFCESIKPVITSDRASYWGYISKDGKIISGKKPHQPRSFKDHYELANKVLRVDSIDAIRHGDYIRFSVGNNGFATFDFNPQPKTVKAAIKFILTHPDIMGQISIEAVDRYKKRIGFWQFDEPDEAIKQLHRMTTLGEDWFNYDYKRAEVETPEGGEDIVIGPVVGDNEEEKKLQKAKKDLPGGIIPKQPKAPPQPTSDPLAGYPYDQEIDSQAKKSVWS